MVTKHQLAEELHYWLKRVDLRRLSLHDHKLFNEAHKLIDDVRNETQELGSVEVNEDSVINPVGDLPTSVSCQVDREGD